MSEALERTKRSLDLIPYILEHQGISLDELAHKFNISTDTLYEDLNLLFCCGLPGYTPLELIDISFEDGIVSVSDPQEFDVPRRLSKEELLRLHLGLELCRKFAPSKLAVRIEGLQRQIADLLQSNVPIEIINSASESKLKFILDAINTNKCLRFNYASARTDSRSERNILAHAISQNMENVYVEGLELSSGIEKIFRLDRISNLEILETFSDAVLEKVTLHSAISVKLKVHHSAQNFLSENSAIILESHDRGDGYEVILREVSQSWLVSEIFAWGGGIEVLEPATLRNSISNLAKSRLARL